MAKVNAGKQHIQTLKYLQFEGAMFTKYFQFFRERSFSGTSSIIRGTKVSLECLKATWPLECLGHGNDHLILKSLLCSEKKESQL